MARTVPVIEQGRRDEEDLLSETQPNSELSAVGVVTGHTFRAGHGGSIGVIYPSVGVGRREVGRDTDTRWHLSAHSRREPTLRSAVSC